MQFHTFVIIAVIFFAVLMLYGVGVLCLIFMQLKRIQETVNRGLMQQVLQSLPTDIFSSGLNPPRF